MLDLHAYVAEETRAAGLAEWSRTWGALALLGVNVLCLILAGSTTLLVQRYLTRRRQR